MSTVEALSWDTTLGLADWRIGRKIIEFMTPNGQGVATGVFHVGIIVFDHVYEHGEAGIFVSKTKPKSNDPGSAYRVDDLKRRDLLGRTKVTKAEFDKWMEESSAEFNFESYDIATSNCISWATAACKFLGVEPPPEWKDVSGLASSRPYISRTMNWLGKATGLFGCYSKTGNSPFYKK